MRSPALLGSHMQSGRCRAQRPAHRLGHQPPSSRLSLFIHTKSSGIYRVGCGRGAVSPVILLASSGIGVVDTRLLLQNLHAHLEVPLAVQPAGQPGKASLRPASQPLGSTPHPCNPRLPHTHTSPTGNALGAGRPRQKTTDSAHATGAPLIRNSARPGGCTCHPPHCSPPLRRPRRQYPASLPTACAAGSAGPPPAG